MSELQAWRGHAGASSGAGFDADRRRCDRWSPASPLRRRSAPARSTGRTKACSSSPTCIWKKARASPRAACCCRPTTPRRRWRGSAQLIARYAPRAVVALGDSFHDGGGPARLARRPTARRSRALQRGRDWIWIAGNHDPDPAARHRRQLRRDARDRRADLPPRAAARRSRRRDRRPSASGGARERGAGAPSAGAASPATASAW